MLTLTYKTNILVWDLQHPGEDVQLLVVRAEVAQINLIGQQRKQLSHQHQDHHRADGAELIGFFHEGSSKRKTDVYSHTISKYIIAEKTGECKGRPGGATFFLHFRQCGGRIDFNN